MHEPDLFVLFRRLLLIFGATYSVLKLIALIGRVRHWLRSRDRKAVMLRYYVLAHIRETQPLRFVPDALQIVVLVVVFGVLLYLHRVVI